MSLLLAWIFTSNGGFHFIVSAGGDMPLHELGHATAWWLCGRAAIPFFFVTLMSSAESSLVVLLLDLSVLGGVAWWARERGLGFVWKASIGLALFAVLATFTSSEERAREIAIFSGCGGALWWSAALVAAFTLDLPESWNWSAKRWFFLVFGACVFSAALHRWARGEIPWGAFLGGDGDMDVLRDRYGWTPEGLVTAYRRVAAWCGLGMAIAWARAVRRAWDEWRGEA